MDRSYILSRTLQTIYDVTGYSCSETDPLDFDSKYDLEEIEIRLMNEFLILDKPPTCYTVRELVDYLCEATGIYLTRYEVKERIKQAIVHFRKALEEALETSLEDEHIAEFVDVDGLVEWLVMRC